MRVVFDTNVLVSTFLFRKRLKPIGMLIDEQVVTPCFTTETFGELEEVFGRSEFSPLLMRIGVTDYDLINELQIYGDLCETQPIVAHVSDPNDVMFLVAAVSCNADAIVTGDRTLRSLGTFHGIPILTPAQFLTFLRQQ
jgi:uncharacterized protein